MAAGRFDLPEFTLPLDWKPDQGWDRTFFPSALDPQHIRDGYAGSQPKTIRELTMMQIMNAITEKPEWERKVFDTEITSQWTNEIYGSGKDVTPKMMEWILAELKHKVNILKATGIVTAFNPGVLRSDTAIPKDLQEALKTAVLSLEQVAENEKDYHPDSDQKVVDLVHPSLFPVVYGRTQILRNQVLNRDECWSWSGQAEILQKTGNFNKFMVRNHGSEGELQPFNENFQWLPCDVELDAHEGCHIISYINNLHPQKHRDLYQVIEKIIDKAIPLWDESLHEVDREPKDRIPFTKVDYPTSDDPEPDWDDNQGNVFYGRYQEWLTARPTKQPEPEGDFKPLERENWEEPHHVRLREQLRESGLQIIVKLTNIELTPENPRYEGGTWHVEGQLNEHICATAIYYYSTENITHSSLSFRQRVSTDALDEIFYVQPDHEFLQSVYGFGSETGIDCDSVVTKDLGDISCIEGRLLTFPNVLQHRVTPFELADKAKPGHRKILALFLVDPHMRIISSANVPPQRADWWDEKINLCRGLLETKLPVELQDMVVNDCGFSPMTMDEAKQYRLELMEERRAKKDNV